MIAIISDIHGNYPALEAVLREIHLLGCNTVISLGDVAGYYCMINECIEKLNSRNIINIMGNHDMYLITNSKCNRSKTANLCLDYQRKITTDKNLKWLKLSLKYLKLNDIYMVHGGWKDELDEYLTILDENYFADYNQKYFFSGHTHYQIIKRFKNKIYCNPGSVGQPRDGDPRAAFAVLYNGKIFSKRISYDVDWIASKMEKEGFDRYTYENLYKGTKIGGELTKTIIL